MTLLIQNPPDERRRRGHSDRIRDVLFERDRLTEEYVFNLNKGTPKWLTDASINTLIDDEEELERQIMCLQQKKGELRMMRTETEYERYLHSNLLERENYEVATRSIRKLCSRMMNTLPRELRDMIYEYVYLKVDYTKNPGYLYKEHSEWQAMRKWEYEGEPPTNFIGNRHLGSTRLDVSQTGQEFLNEYGETYFRLHTFRAPEVDCARMLRFLTTTHPDYGFKPASCTRSFELWTGVSYKYRRQGITIPKRIALPRSLEQYFRQTLSTIFDSLEHLNCLRIVLDGVMNIASYFGARKSGVVVSLSCFTPNSTRGSFGHTRPLIMMVMSSSCALGES
jgi:hypothetical protein